MDTQRPRAQGCHSVLFLGVALQWLVVVGLSSFIYLYTEAHKQDIQKQVELIATKLNSSSAGGPVYGIQNRYIAHFTASSAMGYTGGVLTFEQSVGLAFSTKLMADGNNRPDKTNLTVPQDGIYFVYSQVTIKNSSSSVQVCIRKDSKSYRDTVTLMKARSGSDRGDSIFQAGIFELLAEDKLYVELQGYKLDTVSVSKEEAETFFGVFQLQGADEE